MIRLASLLTENALTSSMHVEGIGRVSCKWDTGADTKASALTAQSVRVHRGIVTWTTRGRRHSAPVTGYSSPKGHGRRPIVELECEWNGRRVKAAFALVDRTDKSTEVLCNLALMRRLGATVDLHKGLQ